jgi:hypothetical protein
MYSSAALVLVVAAFTLTGCGDRSVHAPSEPTRTLRDIPADETRRLQAARIFFGHQSVGADIMAGVEDLVKSTPQLQLRVVQLQGPSLPAGPFFAHEKIGENGKPSLKTDVFATLMEDGFNKNLDIALHKYCFVDIEASTDVGRLFAHYKETLARLRAESPNVRFVHVTTPLTVVQSGWRATVKRMLGREPDHYGDNITRQRYNELMRHEYAGREPLFDLARIESTRPDGSRETISWGDQSAFALVPDYASDGAHLNPVGRRYVAEQLLVFLADVASGR